MKVFFEPPAQYETLGIVKAAGHTGWSQQKDQDHALRRLRYQAGKLGANGVLIGTTGEKTTGAVGYAAPGVMYFGSTTAQTLEGQAIWVLDETPRLTTQSATKLEARIKELDDLLARHVITQAEYDGMRRESISKY